jgi:glycosyltransferase involved in cell wall biosynthesis
MNSPAVSIIIPFKNAAKYLAEALRSIKDQTFGDYELILVDDGSTDNSVQIVNDFGFKVAANLRGEGAPKARNVGLSLAKGEFVKFFDSDDILMPRALEQQVEFAKTLNSNQVGYGTRLEFGSYSNDGFRHEIEHTGAMPFDFYIQTSVPLHRRESLLQIGGFDERIKVMQDWNLHVRLWAAGFRFVPSNVPVTLYRHHVGCERISNRASLGRASVDPRVITTIKTWHDVAINLKTSTHFFWYEKYLLSYLSSTRSEGIPQTMKLILDEMVAIGALSRQDVFSHKSNLFKRVFGNKNFLRANLFICKSKSILLNFRNIVPARKI